MAEKPVEDILPHHVQQPLCTSRLPYRQGRKLTAVKVYTINTESKHLLIFGVPSLNLRQETKSLFLKFGKLLQFNVTAHPSEQFTETYHALYEQIGSARIAKSMLDIKNFYGGILHVSYAPELESIEETREKLLLRQKHVIARLKNLEREKSNPVSNAEIVESLDNKVLEIDKGVGVSNKIYMGDVNKINIGPNIPKKRKLEKKDYAKKYKKNYTDKGIKNVEIGHINAGSFNLVKNSIVEPGTGSTDYEKVTIDHLELFEKGIPEKSIEVVDFTSTETKVLTNINEALNYNNFGNEVIKQVPYKHVNKIKFNINKKP